MNPDGVATRSLRILLIEDHADTLDTIALLLRRSGHQVTTAASRADAYHALADNPPIDVVVSDIGLPDGDGIDLLVELKKSLKVPTIALTAYGMPDDIQRCAQAGVDHHLLKPFGVIELAQTLATLFPAKTSD